MAPKPREKGNVHYSCCISSVQLDVQWESPRLSCANESIILCFTYTKLTKYKIVRSVIVLSNQQVACESQQSKSKIIDRTPSVLTPVEPIAHTSYTNTFDCIIEQTMEMPILCSTSFSIRLAHCFVCNFSHSINSGEFAKSHFTFIYNFQNKQERTIFLVISLFWSRTSKK